MIRAVCPGMLSGSPVFFICLLTVVLNCRDAAEAESIDLEAGVPEDTSLHGAFLMIFAGLFVWSPK